MGILTPEHTMLAVLSYWAQNGVSTFPLKQLHYAVFTYFFDTSTPFFHYHINNLTLIAFWVKFSADDILKYFLLFPRKQDLTFDANCLHWRHLAWTVKACFLGGKKKKNITNLSSAESVQGVVKVNKPIWLPDSRRERHYNVTQI